MVSALRLVPLADAEARNLHQALLWLVALLTVSRAAVQLLRAYAIDPPLVLLFLFSLYALSGPGQWAWGRLTRRGSKG